MLQDAIDRLKVWKDRKIVVAMSGGVDSALAAALLHKAGAQVIGIHMRVWHYNGCTDNAGLATCCSPADAGDARRVAAQFGFPFYSMDFQANFRQAVIEPFMADYLAARTPNPCVNCNNQLKLGSLLAKGKAYGAEAVATGHYGRLIPNQVSSRIELRVAADAEKDQTYYLFGLAQPQLRQMLMPLGELTKPQARALAREIGIHIADKKDSVDICFVTGGDYRKFMEEEGRIDHAAMQGAIVNTRGDVLGRHEGIHNYTIGQRKGLGLAAPRPLFVVDLLPETQTVVVGYEEEIFAREMLVDRLNWVGLNPLTITQGEGSAPLRARVKIRYRSEATLATLHVDPADPSRARIAFDAPTRAITPGQAAVVYDAESAESVLCGGWIARRILDPNAITAEPAQLCR